MNPVEHELKKLLEDQCPLQNITSIIESGNLEYLNQDIMLESIEILKMHESEIRRLRQKIELHYQEDVLKRYLRNKLE